MLLLLCRKTVLLLWFQWFQTTVLKTVTRVTLLPPKFLPPPSTLRRVLLSRLLAMPLPLRPWRLTAALPQRFLAKLAPPSMLGKKLRRKRLVKECLLTLAVFSDSTLHDSDCKRRLLAWPSLMPSRNSSHFYEFLEFRDISRNF